MKKRTICLLLSLVLLSTLLLPALPSASAANNAGYEALAAFLKKNGEQQSSDSYAYNISKTYSLKDGIQVRTWLSMDSDFSSQFIEFYSSYNVSGADDNGYMFGFHMVLHANGTYDQVYSGSLVGEASYNLDPGSFTRSSVLKAYNYTENSDGYHDALDEVSTILLKDLLEFIQPILQQSGKTVGDLGFTKYQAGHQHNLTAKVMNAPTCVWGTKEYACADCKGGYVTPLWPEHLWVLTEILTPATDEEHGTALYTCSRCGETKEAPLCAGEIFNDMPAEDNWAHNAIDWAYFTGITKGTGDNTFSPEMNCTRSQVVTFLWRAAGEPGHESEDCPFTDVEKGSFYYDAMLWAVEKGITKGTGENTFSPNSICTRSEVVTFLWRAAGEPEPSLTESDFTDVPADTWYTQPVLWAVEHEITHGTSATTFAPTVTCSRAQIVTFLYNASKLPAATP